MGIMVNYDGINVKWHDRHISSPDAVIGKVIYQPGGICGPRIQRDYQLVVLHSGECELLLDKEKRTLKNGHISLLLPNHKEHFIFSKEKETHHSWCSIAPKVLPRQLKQQLAEAPFMVPCSEAFNQLLSSAFLLEWSKSNDANNIINSLATTSFFEFLNIARRISEEKGVDTCVTKTLSYMGKHFVDKNCLIKSHEYAGVSRCTLINKFKESMQSTPDRYLWKLRTEKGISLLMDTGLTVSEIAYRCGFPTPFHFSRKVKELQGMSPREIRRRIWTGK
ncbi:helix-turn-helix domain-containing protein [Verrucomicrobiota bacterium]